MAADDRQHRIGDALRGFAELRQLLGLLSARSRSRTYEPFDDFGVGKRRPQRLRRIHRQERLLDADPRLAEPELADLLGRKLHRIDAA